MILSLKDLKFYRRTYQRISESVVATNGCFDILHAGHALFLGEAAQLGHTLVVAVNSDRSVRELKGEGRPVTPEDERAYLVSRLQGVNVVSIFDGARCVDFLEQLQPDVYVKSNDYSLDTMDPDERAVLEQCNAQIKFIPMWKGKSTTDVIDRCHRTWLIEHPDEH